MAERDFKRLRKSAQAGTGPALNLVSSQSNAQSAHPVHCGNSIAYSAGPLYNLAAGSAAVALDQYDAPSTEEDFTQTQSEYTVEKENVIRLLRDSSDGQPLSPAIRRPMERRYGHSFKHVKIHNDPLSHQVNQGLQAKALTYGNHIWLGAHTSPGDQKVIAHELTHVIQQGHGQPLSHRQAIGLNSSGRATARQVSGTNPSSAYTNTPTAAVQRFSVWGAIRSGAGMVVSGAHSLARGAVAVAENVAEMGRDALLALARRVAPDFARLFERDGIRGFLQRMLAQGLRVLFSGPMGTLQRMFNLAGMRDRFSRVANWFITIAGQLARNDCSGITHAARRFGDFMTRTFEPVVERVRNLSRSISEFFSSIWDAVGAPVMDLLRRIGGTVWESIRGFIRDVGAVIRRVREAVGPAWRRVKEWVGIVADEGAEEGGRLWNWIRDKAGQVWERVRGPLQPIMGSLRVVGGVLLLISPAGPVVAAIAAWPYLRQAFQWVRDQWRDLNLVVRARRFWAETVLPAIREAAQRVGDALVRAADWLLDKLGSVSSGIERVTGRLTSGVLAPLGRIIGFLSRQFQRLVNWARGGLRYVATNARSLFRRLINFIRPIMEAFQQLLLAILNPTAIPGIIMGTLWQALPRCLKGPIIDLILDFIIRFLRAMSPTPLLGILWPFVRSAMLGFLERVRTFSIDRKVNVSDKVARIIGGQSLGFFIGYLRGIVLGLWDGIVGPFVAIRDLFQLPGMIRNFLRSLGLRLCDFIRVIRCFMATLTSRAAGALDELMEAAGDLLDNPERIVTMIRCAIQTVLSTVGQIGASIANRMMALFEGPEDSIGQSLGRLVGSSLLDVVLAYFTAGGSAALTVIRQIAGFLRTVGRNIMRVVRMVARLIPRFLGFIRRLGGMFRRAGSRAGGLLGRIGGFFRRIARWFGRLMRRVGRRFRRSGRGRGRGRRRPSRAERARRKRLVEGILRTRLSRGIGRIRLRLLMIALKLRYRIRTLRLRRRGRRRYEVVIRNSPATRFPIHEVHLDSTGRRSHSARMERRRSGNRPSMSAHVRLTHSDSNEPTPAESLAQRGYTPTDATPQRFREVLRDVRRGSIARPQSVRAVFRRYIPSGISRPSGASVATRRKNRFGSAEEYLLRGRPRGRWHGGHLIANQLGGPFTQWNLVPMTSSLNVRAYAAAERWLRREWNELRRPGGNRAATRTRARANIEVSVSGYRERYTVPEHRLLYELGMSNRSHNAGAVSVKGFVPRDVRMEVNFRGRGVVAREFSRRGPASGSGFWQNVYARPETALQASSISGPDDVIMRIGDSVTAPPQPNLPPDETTPRSGRQILQNNRTVFNFSQWRP
ncbi:DUF4157 domain-containing protein [uncultured Desulfobacter sp.]|uniref:eCIS core domain-containing protein n=1 Tax=uncultured Desulfobacter sp. TaxID=240139 RepID=UPI0029F5C5C6|nr:DUF4157 domain-containing protein [uncultured Desulfobacter sp.]